MSWARWAADSDVYVYEDVAGGVTCCACDLSASNFNSDDSAQLLAHFEEHRAAGHRVPERVFEHLREFTTRGWSEAPPLPRPAGYRFRGALLPPTDVIA